jgi:NAD(P)-dependent dehydrogenase (short-subunit alcohol dehydrogenase family)
MKIELSGKTALVTGSSKGIGYSIARGLANTGAKVIINDLLFDQVEGAIAQLRAEVPFATVEGVAADLGTEQGCAELVAQVPSVDILINSVGIYSVEDFFETTDEAWLRIFNINVMSGVRLSRAYLPAMVDRAWGRVVFISSESALNVPPDMIHYATTKTSNLTVSRGLAKRVAGTGVTVNAVLPGPTLSEGVQALLKDEQEASGLSMEETAAAFVVKHRPTSLIRRAASMEEVANMVVYVSSIQASATTGAALRVDGGVVDTIA